MGKRMFHRRVIAVVALLFLASSSGAARSAAVTFEKILPLKPNEGVFAYARISPNGRYLAYASEMPNPSGRGITQTETIVDLKNQSVLFSEPGIDGYFSNDNERVIFLSFAAGRGGVAMWHQRTGEVTRNVAPQRLGDYFSWSVRDGKNVILNRDSNPTQANHGVLGVLHAADGIVDGNRWAERPNLLLQRLDHEREPVESRLIGRQVGGRQRARDVADGSR